MYAVNVHFRNMRVTVSVSCLTEEKRPTHSLVGQRNVNHTFTTGSVAVVFDILGKKFVKYL